MTRSQRLALTEMVEAILACSCAPADIRARAEILRAKLAYGPLADVMSAFTGVRP